jgi:hypothetical protein
MELTLSLPTLPLSERRRHAALTLVVVLVLGTFTQALFWRTGLGVNFSIWNLLVLVSELALFRRRPGRVPPTAIGAITASLLLSLSIVVYASDWTLAIAVPADLALLVAIPFLLRDRPTIAGIATVPMQALRSLGKTPRAARAATDLSREALGGGRELIGVGKGLLLGVPTATLFALLLSVDDDFRRVLGGVFDRCGEACLFTAWSLATAAAYLLVFALPPPIGDRDAFVPGPYRGAEEMPVATPRATARVTPVAWAMVIGQVAAIFGVFVVANLQHLFGGQALVRAPGATTYASYLHAGFAQLLLATALSVCLVVTGHRLLRARDPAGETGPVPGGRVLMALEGALLALTGVTVASCAQRLAIYEDAYGATRQRLGVAVIGLAILGVLGLTFAKVVARGWRGHGGATLALLTGIAVFSSGINADAYVATTNLDRSARGKYLDVAYLSTMSCDARSVLGHPVVRANAALAKALDEALRRNDTAGWRARRGL